MHDTELGGFGTLPQRSAQPSPDAPEPFALAPAQLGVWYAQLLQPDVPINVAQYVDVRGELNAALLQEVSIEAAREYESVLVRLGESGGVPYQCVDSGLSVDIPLVDLRDQEDPVAAAHAWMRADASAPVDLLADRLFAGAVLRVAERRYFWYLRAHHIVLDGYGALTNTVRVAERYTARILGAEPSVVRPEPLAALTRAELAYRDSPRFESDRAYWAARVAGLDGAAGLGGRAAPRRAANVVAGRALAPELVDRMNALAAEQDSTLAVVLLAAFAAYLGRLTDRDEAVLSLPVTGRTTAALRRSAGMLSNIVPLRVPVDGTWGELLRATRVEVAGALRHQRYRHEDIQRDAERAAGLAHRGLFGPLANIMLFRSDLTLGATVGRYHVLSTGPIEDLGLTVYYGDRDRVHVDFEANPHLYTADDVARQHARFLRYLERLAATEPDTALAAVDVATELELEVSTRIWNETGFDVEAQLPGRSAGFAPVATLVSMFEAQAARTPSAVALRAAGAPDLTYRELAVRSNRLARRLIALGVGPETLVALRLPRSPELVIAMYAVLAAGGAYLPLDPDHPPERTAHILATARPACVLTAGPDQPPELSGLPAVRVDQADETVGAGPIWDRERVAALRPEHPAYVIFTSGSTGLPKGVAISHRAIVNRLVWMQQTYRLSPEDVVLQKTPATFDVSVWEFFWPLQIGATLVLAQPDGHRDPAYLRRVIDEYHVTTAHFVPSMLEAFLADQDTVLRTPLRTVFASGEALPAALAQRLRALTGVRLHNLYGPTEAAVDVTFHEVTDTDTLSVPIGAPVFNTRLYVLDSRLRPVPVGAPGELYLSGVQLARGYVGRPELTAARFVADPFGGPNGSARAGDRMYRTGDLVRWTTHGELEYLGRTDFQVKLRGLRIELGEIEAVLARVDAVARAVVVVRDDAGAGAQLVAYVVAADPDAVRPELLRAAAARALPGYMVPAVYVVLDTLPVNASGKLDRRALPAPGGASFGYVAPVTPVERAVARVFGEVLGNKLVGRDDDFFALGGNSLVATQVAARLSADLNCPLGVRDVFAACTVAELAGLVERAGGSGGASLVAQLRARPRPPLVPLSPAQHRIWFLNRFERSGASYNMPFVVRLHGAVDATALRQALADVVIRHEVLRTIFPALPAGDGDGPAAQQVVLSVAEVAGAPEAIAADELGACLRAFAARGFDLEREIPIRARIFAVDDGSHALALVLHHIAADGLSLRVLARDVMTAYGARRGGVAPAWAPLPVQYADYSLWQLELLGSAGGPFAAAQLSFWTGALAGAPDQLDLPAARPRPAVASGRGATFGFELPGEVISRMGEFARARGVSTFMLTHAALAALLSRLSGSADIVIGTPVAGRGDRALDDLIGMFVNTLALRTRVDAAAPFTELLAHVRERDLAAFGHAELPFEQVVAALDPPRSQARHPLFQVLLAFDNAEAIAVELPELSVATSTLETGVTKLDLQLTVTENSAGAGLGEGSAPAGVPAEFTYATDLFDSATIAGYARALIGFLDAITADPGIAVRDLPLLDHDGRARALAAGQAPAGVQDPAETLLTAFETQVRRTPGAVAVLDDERQLSYAEFAGAVNRLARRLIAAGVGPERTVVLGLRRSIDFVVAAYAVLTAGGGYVPVDPDQPAARIAQVIAAARPVCVLTRTRDGRAEEFAEQPVLPVIAVDGPDVEEYSDTPVIDAHRTSPLRASGIAYVIFTSGSTGRPKGVAVQHDSAVNQIRWLADEYRIDANDVVLFKTPATFDVSVWELFAPLTRGARIVVADHDGHRDPRYLAKAIAAHQVTMTSFVPSMLTVFAAAVPEAISSLRTVLVAGEAMTGEAAAAFAAVSRARLHNLYGPTEFTVHATHAPVDPAVGGPAPIGRPVPGSRAVVLDARLRLVPDAVVGELYLSGVQLARGYHGRAGLSAERFVADPHGPAGSRMYRTGDLVRRRRDGALEYLGRSDFQVKLRGQRIELGEIEAALLAMDDVRAAAVRVVAQPSGATLAAYVVCAVAPDRLAAELEQRLRRVLPSYMVPTAYVALTAMPLTSSGKLDRTALPDPQPVTKTFRAPGTPGERTVAAVFGQALGVDLVGADDDFFALGGNSLVATQIAARLADAMDTEVPVRALFEYPTVAALAAHLSGGGRARNRARLVAGARPPRVPLSYAQQRMWFLNQFDTASVADNLVAAIRLRGALDRAALADAAADVLARHESLRTIFPAAEGIPYQLVLPVDEARVELVAETLDGRLLPERIRELVGIPFRVDREPPVRLALLRLGDNHHVLVVALHHISADGWSLAPLTRDLMRAYSARRAGAAPDWTPLGVHYADYALWQRETLGSEDDPDSILAGQIRFWRGELAGLPDVSALPADRPRPAVASGRGARHAFTIDAATRRRLREIADAANASLFMVLHAAFAALLATLSGQRDIVLGTPVAGRGDRALDELVGMFVNTVVLRADVRPELTFTGFVAAIRERDLAAFAHADAPFERLVEVLAPERSAARHPLFQVMLDWQNTARTELELPGLTVSRLDIDTRTAKFDLHLSVAEAPDGALTASFEYATDLFDPATVASYALRLRRVLEAVVADPQVSLEAIDVLGSGERALVLHARNATGYPVDPEATLVSLFEAQAARTPDAIALTFEGESLTYAEFARRVHRLARLLVSVGVRPDKPVAVGMQRSVDLVVALYAVLAAGGAYVPIDPGHPAERVADVLRTVRPVCVLTRSEDGLELPSSAEGSGLWAVLDVDLFDTEDYSGEPLTDADRLGTLTPSNTAYVIFTSGSTGRPKGVAVSHAAIVNRLVWMQTAYQLTPADVVLQKTPATFDVSVWEFFWPSQIGARLVVAKPDGHRDPAYLAEVISAEKVTVTHFVPSMLAVFVADTAAAQCGSLRLVFASGEALPPKPAHRLRELTGAALHNLYGPTEAAVDVTFHEVVDADTESVPIGAPVFNTQVFVLDARLRPVPVGVAGELYLAGVQLARGYVARPDLTSDRFVANPYGVPGARMYRTGDLVAWTEHGELEYLGRTDFQVKLRGLRIELGEIEQALTGLDEIAQAVVVVRNDAGTGERLVAYLIETSGTSLDLSAVEAALTRRLPAYMVPSAYVVLTEFPVNASGKLDRRALPAPVVESARFRAPATPVQELVAVTFGDLLGVDRVGLDDDFFALGGNSLTAARAAARLGAALDTQLPVRMLFDAPTVAALAARAEAHRGDGGRAPLRPRPRPDRIPLSPAQQRIWFVNRFHADEQAGPADAIANIPVALRLAGEVDLAAMTTALADVVARHETLRTVYPDGPDGPEQLILPSADPDLPVVRVTENELAQRLGELAATPFDLTTETPLRAILFAIGDAPQTEYVLALVLHHIAADGFSLGPLAEDLMTAYSARRAAAAPAWDALPVQYADYALWQAESADLERQLDYWRRVLDGLPEQLELPADRPRPAVSSHRGATHRLRIDSDLHSELGELARKRETTLFSTVHAALAVLVARLSGGSDIAIGTPVAGRGDAALDRLVGMFVNTLVLRTAVDSRARFETVLDAVRDQDLDALSHADVPFERLVEALAPTRSRNRHPLFQVALTFQNFALPDLELPGLRVRAQEFDAPVAEFDLQFTVLESNDRDGRADGMRVEIRYATDLFDAPSIEVLGRRFTQVLAAVAADPTVVVGDIQLLSAEEQHRALYEWPVGGDDVADVTGSVAERFARAAALDPDAVAVRDGARSLTYAELDDWSNRLARRLVAAGVGPETLVAVALPRSAELVVALLAVLEAGGGYLPIDPAYPDDRIEYVLDDARPICAIAGAATELPRGWFGGPVIDVDAPNLAEFDGAPITDADRRGPLCSAHVAYVIYTSGSTGRPKGVVVPHRNVLRLLDNTRRRFGFGPADVWTLFHSYAFDFSVWELWGPLLSGATVVVVDYYTSRSPQQFRELLIAERVTVLNQTPSAFYQLVAADLAEPEPAPFALRTVVFGGEALEPQRLAGWFARYSDGPRLVNMYGITETTVHVSYREIDGRTGSASVIGGALPGLTVRLLDDRLRPVPVGVPGEIYVSGGQLARGYLHRPALTAGRFVADPYAGDGSLAYRSGDLARWTPDGDLEYLGRADQQVNLRGFRIELGEIEAALLDASDAVREVAVVVRTDLVDEPRIVAYVVAADEPIDTAALRQALMYRLPEHMVPAAIVPVPGIPLTVNGKLDRAALPAPRFESTAYRAPSTSSERVVAEVFAEVLGSARAVGADDDFFALGGSSLLAAKAVARIGAALGRTVGVRALFEAPRVADLAAVASAVAMGGARPPLVAGPRPARIPLSPAQQRMWFLNRFDQSSTAYNIPVALRLSGRLDVAALQAALADVIARHEALRTRYPQVDGEPVQLVVAAADAAPALRPVDIPECEVPQRVRELAETTFDVTVEIPVRIRLFRVTRASERPEDGYGEFVLAAVLHHISADGSSIAPFVRDLMVAYTARRDGAAPEWAPLAVQYADYALWQRDLLGAEDDAGSVAAREIEFWTETLAGLPDQLALPTDRPRPAKQSLRGDQVPSTIGARLHADLAALGRRHGATLFMVLHTAFAVLLARWSGTGDIAIGTPVAGRGAAELDDVVGMFVNTLVLRVGVDGGESFAGLLARARAADLAALEHATVPFERLVEVLNPVRSTARHPLFQVGYSFQNHERGHLRLPGLEVRELDFDQGVAQFDLHLFAVDAYDADGLPDGVDLALRYATDLFERPTAFRFAAQLRRVLETVAARPDLPVGDIDLLGTDRSLVLAEWNRTRQPVARATLADLIDAQTARSPRAVALVDATTGAELSYAEFGDRVNRLARRLIAAGIGPESTVVLAMRRSPDLVVAMYAVVSAGAAYVPIDPDHPAERIAHIMSVAAPAVVLTTSADGVPTGTRCVALEVDRLELDGFAATPITDAERVRPLRPEHPAYVVFTSGSTGLPKGVTIPHAAIVNQLAWLVERFGLGADDRVLLKTPATFDLSVWELWSPLVTGGRLIVTAPGAERDPDLLRALLRRHGVTVLHAVPALIGMLLAAEPGATLPETLRHVLAIGEALPAATAADFLRRHRAATTLDNLYGPTEAAVSITAFPVRTPPEHTVPIGSPAWNSRVYVLDQRLRPAPIGVPGELYLAGAQLARGYRRRPALTADRFVADPFAAEPGAAGERMYRTGDIVRWRPDGTLEYLERADFQVQIGGFRIELGEVEAALLRQPGVSAAVAVALADERAGTRLIAYAALPEADPGTYAELAASLRTAVAALLPGYMTPAAVVVLAALPLTANGKIDRAALPEPMFAEAAFRAPAGALERLVAEAFAEVIGVDAVSVDDDFFARGGNSLMATRLAARLGAALGGHVPVAAVFEAPTPAALAERLAVTERGAARPALVRRAGAGPAPLAPAQQRMWVVHRLAPDSSAYHIPAALRLRGELDVAALAAAVGDVLDRHETLRTRYPDTEAGPVQEVVPASPVGLTPIPVPPAELETRIAEFVSLRFDLATAPPVRAALFGPAAGDHVLVVVLHHIAADGYSIAPLTADLVRAYAARSAGHAPEWAEPAIRYRDYSAWQHETLGDAADPDSLAARQLAFWRAELAAAPEVLALPTDRPRPARRSMHGASVLRAIDAERTVRLERLAREHGGTLFTLVHSALAVLLAKLSGSGDITVGVPVAGRGVRELDDLVGMFVNTVALRTEVDPRASFAELLRQATRRDLAALSHADVPFDQVVEALGVIRSASYAPLCQVLLTFQNMPRAQVELPGLAVEAVDLPLAQAKFDLQVTVLEQFTADGARTGLELRFGYATDIFDEATAQAFGDRLLRVLETVAGDPAVDVRAIDIRSADERRPRSAPSVADLPALIARAAQAAPDAPAFDHGDRQVRFGELDAKLAAVARAMGPAAKPEAVFHVSLAGLVPGLLAALGGSGLAALLQTLPAAAEAVLADPASALDSEGNR